MADFRRRAWITRARPSIPPRIVDEEIHPSSGWTGTPDTHCLLVDLPGFKKNEISFNVEETGIILVKGRRSKGENKQEHFEKTFNVPEDGDIKRVSMEFDGDTLRVRVPKLPKKENGEAKTTAEASSRNIEEEEEEEEEPNIPASSSSIPTKEDKPEKTESPASTTEKEKKVQPTSPDSSSITKETSGEVKSLDSSSNANGITEEKKAQPTSPDSSSITKDTEGEVKSLDSSSNTDGITNGEAKIPPPSIDTSRSEKKDEPALSSHPENGKQKEPETTKEVGTKAKPDVHSQMKKSLGQGEKSSKPSVMGKIIENKSILIASVISFTLGVLLSQKFHPSHPQ